MSDRSPLPSPDDPDAVQLGREFLVPTEGFTLHWGDRSMKIPAQVARIEKTQLIGSISTYEVTVCQQPEGIFWSE